jgi:hypothetical protein
MKTFAALLALFAFLAVSDARVSVFPSASPPDASPVPSLAKPLLDRFSAARWGAIIEASYAGADDASFVAECHDAAGSQTGADVSWTPTDVVVVLTGLEPGTPHTCRVRAVKGDASSLPLVVDFATKA